MFVLLGQWAHFQDTPSILSWSSSNSIGCFKQSLIVQVGGESLRRLVSTLQRLIYIRFFCSAGFALAKLALI